MGRSPTRRNKLSSSSRGITSKIGEDKKAQMAKVKDDEP
jgi:hypothetical protein